MKNIKVFIAVLLCLICTFYATGCLKYTDNIISVTKERSDDFTPEDDYPDVTQPRTDNTTEPSSEDVTNDTVTPTVPVQIDTPTEVPVVTQPNEQNPPQETPTEPQLSEQNGKDPSQWSKTEILDCVTAAVNKSKAYKGKLSVDHKESFDVSIDNISIGGSLIRNTANEIIGSVTKPTDETLNFVNGKTTTSEGETVPILLPKRQNFCLTPAGLASAKASKKGNDIVVSLKIVEENTTISNPVPKHNAASCGYMSLADVELPSIVKVTKLDMKYTGSTIQLTINDKGYVSNCTYSIPVKIDGSGKLGASADFSVTAKIVEVWKLNW